MRIREFRQRANLTQKELGTMLDVDQSAVCRWERGEGIARKYIPKLAAALGCTVDDLLAEKEAGA